METKYRVCLFNSADPRGKKVGGIETYIRDYIYYHPEEMELLFVGADEVGDLAPGVVSNVSFRGRTIKFLPLYRLDNSVNVYPTSIFKSEGFFFAKSLLKNWRMIRRLLRTGKYSAEVRRVEFAPIIWSMGIPFVQMVHIWGSKDAPMSGLQGKYWYIRDSLEFVAAALCKKFYSVNEQMTERYKKKYFPFKSKFETLTTWANTDVFSPTAFPEGSTIKLIYAGRLDKFKRPDVMFKVVSEVARRSSIPVEFHYVGDGDPSEFEEFDSIRAITICHGRQDSAKISKLIGAAHVGLLTSEFEGMPRFVLESLTSGRPVVALHLPQLERVIKKGISGCLVAREGDYVGAHAGAVMTVFEAIRQERMVPSEVAKAAGHHAPREVLGKIFKRHEEIHGARDRAALVG